ncbi:MAG: UDP-3-O-(3-hydroxymyristoyl)glucosamine N-acyltransferase [Alphaproteobacteria bacterium]|nr:UDP-3-O-(3-hydroxymyristoyl)glucosamine N-acyltransferase [Alphaproteobacteria bacterium]
MVDTRFFDKATPLRLSDIAAKTGSALSGDDKLIESLAPLDAATATDLSFLDNPKYIASFTKSAAGACFLRQKFALHAPEGMSLLITDQPYAAYATLAAHMYPAKRESGVHPTAIIGENVSLGEGVAIGPYCVIGDGVIIGDGTQIGAHCTISHAIIGKHCLLHRGIQIGQDGFGFAPTPGGLLKVPQLGRVVIGDHVEIGSNSCIDRGAGPDTTIGSGSKIDNLVQIGHNVQIGNHCVIVSQVGLAGSTIVGDGAMLGGQVGVSGHLSIGAGAKIAAQSGISADIPPGATYGGYPAMPVRDWHRQTVALSRLVKTPITTEE